MNKRANHWKLMVLEKKILQYAGQVDLNQKNNAISIDSIVVGFFFSFNFFSGIKSSYIHNWFICATWLKWRWRAQAQKAIYGTEEGKKKLCFDPLGTSVRKTNTPKNLNTRPRSHNDWNS